MGKQYADTTTRERAKQNMFSYWFPRVQGHGIDTPRSLVFQLPRSKDGSEIDQELYKALFMEDGEKDIETIQKWLDADVISVLRGSKMRGRLFIKNGTFSNKFWAEGSCIVDGIGNLATAVANVNYGALCGNPSGLGELVVRQFIWCDRRKTPCIYNGLPLRPEFRVFYDFDERQVIFTVNYWDSGYVEHELHDLTDRLVFQNKKKKLERFYVKHKDEVAELVEAAMADVDLDGVWSVDIMWDAVQKKYWLIDMAVAETSTYWDRRPGVEQKPEQRTHKPHAGGVGEERAALCVLPSGPKPAERESEPDRPKPSTEGGGNAGPIIFDRYAGLRYGRRETENRFSFWFNKINKPTTVEAGLDIPKTLIVQVPLDVICAFGDCSEESMKAIEAWFQTEVRLAVKTAGLDRRMLFIKNASFSNKFYGNQSCLATSATLMSNFINIQQTAAEVLMGYDGLDELIIRERIMYDSATTACIYHGLPLRPEYRVFYDFDLRAPIFIANYWDEDYVGGHLSDATDKVVFHKRAPYIKSEYEENKYMVLNMVAAAMDHVTGLSGPWSIDVMQTGDRFYIIDMAVAEESAYWEFRPGVAREGRL